MNDKIKAIETVYKGCRFRSRLEARWAVFFDCLGMEWRYEAEGYQLKNRWWLPDFWLPKLKVLVEIKATEEETGIVFGEIFSNYWGEDYANSWSLPGIPVVIWGDIPIPEDLPTNHIAVPWDEWYEFCICEYCGAVGLEFESRSGRIKCGCPDPGDGRSNAGDPRISAAYRAARSARFERGESGAPR